MRRLALIAFIVAILSALAKSAAPPVGRVIWDIPGAYRLIRTADEVYVLPVSLIEKRDPRLGEGGEVSPRADFKHLRRLDPVASERVQRLLGKESNWFHGADNTVSIDFDRRTVGFIFRKGKDKLILLCGLGARLEGTFNGEDTGGSLEFKQRDMLDDWKKQYARPELGIK